jgi:hypothetical protein
MVNESSHKCNREVGLRLIELAENNACWDGGLAAVPVRQFFGSLVSAFNPTQVLFRVTPRGFETTELTETPSVRIRAPRRNIGPAAI